MMLLMASLITFQVTKCILHGLIKFFIVSLDLGLSVLNWILKLHACKLVDDVTHGLSDHIPGYFVLLLCSCLYRVTSEIIKCDDILQHAHSLVEGTIPIIWTVTILL